MSATAEKQQLSYEEAAEFLGIGRTSLFKLVRRGEIRKTMSRGVRRTTFSRKELERYVAANTRPAKG